MIQALNRYPKLLALLAGFASSLGFAPLGLWPVTFICFAVLLHLVAMAPDLKGALARGYWFGVGHFTLGLNWIAGSFRYQDAMPVWLGWFAVVALALYLAVYTAMAAGLAWRYGRQNRVVFILFFAAAWIVTEWLRATIFTGFSWNPLAAVFLRDFSPPPLLTVVGTYGVSGIIVLFAGFFYYWFRRIRETAEDERRFVVGRFLGWWVLSGVLASLLTFETPYVAGKGGIVHVVQPNIGQDEKHAGDQEVAKFRKLEAQSGIAGEIPRLILWPEDAAPGFIESEEWGRARIASILGPRDVLLTGGDALVYDKRDKLVGARNSLFVVTANGAITSRYDKAHLVPYGEYLALRWLLEPLGAQRLVQGDIDFLPGTGPRTIAIPGFGKVGAQICYEIIFSGEVVDRANRPDFIFNPSNDSWFGSWGPPQFVEQARLRAIEEGLPIIRSTPTGISAIIDANGRITHSIPQGRAGAIEAQLPPAHAPTLFARYGNILSFAFALILTLIAVALRRRVA